ncbi:hypothetical protein ACFO0N_07360 [Halobium salinum]|uniref:Uncharacterized protein n=1 Tax=Halobium salinum TaxID=1364940 RepID=A0ABD5PA55_9EURY|nr:hypothetical protein [Halobium salinum]
MTLISKATLKELIEVLGIFSMFGMSVFTYLVWWVAFKQGGTIQLHIDFFGEMWFEYVLWMVVTPVITLAMYYYLKGENRTRTRESSSTESDTRITQSD